MLGVPSRNLKWEGVTSKRCAQNIGTSGSEIRKPREREDVRNPADRVFVLLRNEQENKRADERREEDDRKYVILHKKLLASSYEPRLRVNHLLHNAARLLAAQCS